MRILAYSPHADPAKKAIQDVGDFVGDWKGNGEAKAGLKTDGIAGIRVNHQLEVHIDDFSVKK